METAKEKTCENCRFYLQHYVRTGYGYASTNCGHCICDELNDKRSKNRYTLQNNCEYWQPIEIQKAKRKQRLKEQIKYLAKYLIAVSEVLIDDND